MSDDGNLAVDAAVQDVVARFGPGPGHGWLAQGVTVDEVAAAYAARRPAIASDPQRPPEGVRAAYNRAA